ncbi:hypothetical protein C8P63_10774 [Melghirimyces profundicolus]|uniref:YpzI-like protein n=1 Tax=Melghirimyces profundicolus TaxID=1242148 RepID=A0A2T6BYY2_9BACL|nr:hypothetical protein [Melghirimyces profundicolus]PTX61279.1 hypothetical protein C8P63_10774 [Melghirimyces profundicolus]
MTHRGNEKEEHLTQAQKAKREPAEVQREHGDADADLRLIGEGTRPSQRKEP